MLKKTALILLLMIAFIPVLNYPVFSQDRSLTNDSDHWMQIMSDGKKIGYTHTIIKNDKSLTKVYEKTEMNLTVLSTKTSFDLISDYTLKDGKIDKFTYIMRSESASLDLTGLREGDKLLIKNKGNNSRELTIELNRDYILPSLIPVKLSSMGMKKEDEYTFYLFDPIIFYTGGDKANLKADVEVLGKEEVSTPSGSFNAYKVKVSAMGTSSDMWITPDGKKIKEEIPPGFVSYLSDESAKNRKNEDSFDIISKTSIPSDKTIENAREVTKMKVEIQGVDDLDKMDLNDGYRQFLNGNTLTVKASEKSGSTKPGVKTSPGETSQYLIGSNLINTTDKKIVLKSKEITGNENDPKEKARLINDWVFENLKKVPMLSIPDSVEILQKRKGDCNEHAVLFAALTRAAGVPVKVVLGLVYLDGRFYYHAWDEIYSDGWIAVDPTFGQFPADATHIKLLEGDISRSTDIIRVVGKIQLNVLYYE